MSKISAKAKKKKKNPERYLEKLWRIPNNFQIIGNRVLFLNRYRATSQPAGSLPLLPNLAFLRTFSWPQRMLHGPQQGHYGIHHYSLFFMCWAFKTYCSSHSFRVGGQIVFWQYVFFNFKAENGRVLLLIYYSGEFQEEIKWDLMTTMY